MLRGTTYPPNECPGYDTIQSDGEVTVMLELWGMRSAPSFPLLQGLDSPINGSNRIKQRTYAKLYCLKFEMFLHVKFVIMLN